MFGIGMAKTPVSQRPKINKLVYFEVIKTVFKDCLYIRSQDGFFFVHLYQLKRFLSGIIIVLFFLKYISIHFVQSNLKPGSNRLKPAW